MHADEQRKTFSSFHWQMSFPPWPRGKSNCLPNCPHRLALILDGSRTVQVQLCGPRSTQNSSQSWACSGGKHYAVPQAQGGKRYCLVFLTNIYANFLNLTVGDSPVGLVH